MKLFEIQILLEMGAKKACAVCGHSMANFHFYRKGGWYCKTTSLSAPAPGADVAACKAALAAGKAPRVSNNASTPSVSTPTTPVNKTPASAPTPAPQPTVAPASLPTPAPTAPKPALLAGSQQEKISAWLNAQGINNFTINKDDSVDVADSILLNNLRYKKLPVQFNRIDGDVHIAGGLLETLQGLPTDLSGDLSISGVQLRTWDGCPTSVNSLDLHSITIPGPLPKFKSIPGIVSFAHVKGLTTLTGLPDTVGGIDISECKHLGSLSGLPKQINGPLHIQEYNSSNITTLEALNASNVDGGVVINIAGSKRPITLPSKFNTTETVELSGVFSGSIAFPAEIEGDLILESRYDTPTSYKDVKVTSWPSKINGSLTMSADLLGSIQKISRVIREVDGIITIQHTSIPNPDSPYQKAGEITVGAVLGLTQIKGVKKIDLNGSANAKATAFLEHTLNRVLTGDIEMLEAQEILIEAGYSKQARL